MPSEDKSTPRPWSYQERSDAYTHIVRGPGGCYVVQFPQDLSGSSEASARLIVTAVNERPQLLAIKEAAEKAHKWLDGIKCDDHEALVYMKMVEARELLGDALAACEGEKPPCAK